MSDTLTREPLLLSLSFVDGHPIDPDFRPPADQGAQPLGYLYSTWDGTAVQPAWGHFDEETQTWINPPGLPTAGITTYTRTNCYSTDRCYDDTCG
ncbi:hypothetical protein [Spirillospora sp. CA-294931]|uniref:hypothetical protein n=1 Tax=Spirillospora sp. CA-294931 TaxID=3240042 RepID=UPI003D8BECAD